MASHRLLTNIDWFIFEELDTAHVYESDACRPVAADDLESILFAKGSPILLVPVGRHGDHHVPVTLNTPCTVGDALTILSDFYQKPVDDTLLEIVDETDYSLDVRRRMAAGEAPRMYELNGSDACFDFGADVGHRRHPFSCSGAVRFEGLMSVLSGVYTVMLGT